MKTVSVDRCPLVPKLTARAGSEAAFGEDADRAVRGGGAERAVPRVEGAKGPGQIDAPLDRGLAGSGLAVPGGKAIVLAELLGERLAVAAGDVEREQPAVPPPPLADDPRGDAARLVAQHDAGEGADAAARRVEGRQALDQVEEQILPQVIEVGPAQAQAAPQTRGGGVGLVQDSGKVGSGDRGTHCSVPRSSLSMRRECRGGRARWWVRCG